VRSGNAHPKDIHAPQQCCGTASWIGVQVGQGVRRVGICIRHECIFPAESVCRGAAPHRETTDRKYPPHICDQTYAPCKVPSLELAPLQALALDEEQQVCIRTQKVPIYRQHDIYCKKLVYEKPFLKEEILYDYPTNNFNFLLKKLFIPFF